MLRLGNIRGWPMQSGGEGAETLRATDLGEGDGDEHKPSRKTAPSSPPSTQDKAERLSPHANYNHRGNAGALSCREHELPGSGGTDRSRWLWGSRCSNVWPEWRTAVSQGREGPSRGVSQRRAGRPHTARVLVQRGRDWFQEVTKLTCSAGGRTWRHKIHSRF